MGDASGRGEDHFDLVAPGLRKGLPTFCDKPIWRDRRRHAQDPGAGAEHKAPLMSSSLFRHEFGMEQALAACATRGFGPLEVRDRQHGRRVLAGGGFVYGQHPRGR